MYHSYNMVGFSLNVSPCSGPRTPPFTLPAFVGFIQFDQR